MTRFAGCCASRSSEGVTLRRWKERSAASVLSRHTFSSAALPSEGGGMEEVARVLAKTSSWFASSRSLRGREEGVVEEDKE